MLSAAFFSVSCAAALPAARARVVGRRCPLHAGFVPEGQSRPGVQGVKLLETRRMALPRRPVVRSPA